MDEIIAKYLKKELTLEEQHKLSLWLQESPQNAETLRKIENFWNNYRTDSKEERLEVEERIMKRIRLQHQPDNVRTLNRIYDKAWLRAAAVIVICLAVVFILHKLSPPEVQEREPVGMIEKVSIPGQKITTMLPDGSKVKLNSGSKLITPERFDGNTRQVSLFGEAFFDVVEDPSKPFIIHTEKLAVRVLGTSFNVRVFPERENVIAVKTGKVLVKSNLNGSIELSTNQMVNVSDAGDISEVIAVNDKVFAWIDNELIFDDDRIEEVFETLKNWYGVEFILNPKKFSDQRYTARFANPGLPEVMMSLSKFYEFQFKIDENGNVIIDS